MNPSLRYLIIQLTMRKVVLVEELRYGNRDPTISPAGLLRSCAANTCDQDHKAQSDRDAESLSAMTAGVAGNRLD